jgi:hypothetical protein
VEELTDVFTRPPSRIEIDLNVRTKEGYTRARLARAHGPVSVGDAVVAYEPHDRVAADAVVVDVDRSRGFVYLAVDWNSLRDDPVPVMRRLIASAVQTASAVSEAARLRIRRHLVLAEVQGGDVVTQADTTGSGATRVGSNGAGASRVILPRIEEIAVT